MENSGRQFQQLDLNISEQLKDAVENLVVSKYKLDRITNRHSACMVAGTLYDGAYGPHEGWGFLGHVLPFLKVTERLEEPFNALVPVPITLGCSWKWTGETLAREERTKLAERLTDAEALIAGTLDEASYTLLEPMGIVIPGEGKNRVDFLREEGRDLIPAQVTRRAYPTADLAVMGCRRAHAAEALSELTHKGGEAADPSNTV